MSLSRPAALPIRIARQGTVYGIFFLLVCIFTYPLILHPGSMLRGLNDPYLFTWILNWAASHVVADPRGLFDANIFYPYGATFAYSEPLLVPALLTAAPILSLSGNPVLVHNLTLLLFQALCGWAAWFATSRITGSRTAGWIAGIAFAVSPFRTGYYNYLNVHMQCAIPLALVSLALYLEKRSPRYLAATVILLWLQMITIFYGGVPLGMLLALFFAGFLLLRPAGWQVRTWCQLLAGGSILLLLLAPVLSPYYQVFRELGLERSLKDVIRYSADWYSFFDTGRDHNFYQLADSGRYPGFFPGFTVYILAGLALLSLWRNPGDLPRRILLPQRIIGATITLLCAVVALLLVRRQATLPLVAGLSISIGQATLAILLLGTLALAVRGQAVRAAGSGHRPLARREWIMLLGLLSLFFALLTLGPVMHIQGRPAGTGIYAWLYKVFLPLHTIRLSIRLGYMPVLLLAMLAGFGLATLRDRLPRRLRPLLWLLPIVLLFEYSSFPLHYQRVNWNATPPVYRWLAGQKGDFAVLEWPSNNEGIDSRYVFWSLRHHKKEVTGVSGFFPPFTRRVVRDMIRFPAGDSITHLRRIYPLRYLIVHGDLFFRPEHQRLALTWADRVPTGMTLVRRFGNTMVFAFQDRPETVRRWERTFSSALVKKRPVAVVTVAMHNRGSAGGEIGVEFNGRLLGRIRADSRARTHRIPLPGPYPAADRNIFRLLPMSGNGSMTVSGFRLDRNP